jgi:hypothetical protein
MLGNYFFYGLEHGHGVGSFQLYSIPVEKFFFCEILSVVDGGLRFHALDGVQGIRSVQLAEC